jgi:phage shock protein A
MNDIINSNINAMLDKAEDPEKIVRLIIQEMEDTLVQVRSASARAIADRKQLERRIAIASSDETEWRRRAELAVSKERDDLARAALAERARVSAALGGLKEQHEDVAGGLEKLNDDIAVLQEKLADAKHRQKSLQVRRETASHRLEVRRRIADERIDDALGRFEYCERKMEHMEGKVEAYDLGNSRGLSDEFATLESNDQVEQDLAELKERMGATASADAGSE